MSDENYHINFYGILNKNFPHLVDGLVVGRGVVAMASAGWGVAKGEELSTSPIAASSCRIIILIIIELRNNSQ